MAPAKKLVKLVVPQCFLQYYIHCITTQSGDLKALYSTMILLQSPDLQPDKHPEVSTLRCGCWLLLTATSPNQLVMVVVWLQVVVTSSNCHSSCHS